MNEGMHGEKRIHKQVHEWLDERTVPLVLPALTRFALLWYYPSGSALLHARLFYHIQSQSISYTMACDSYHSILMCLAMLCFGLSYGRLHSIPMSVLLLLLLFLFCRLRMISGNLTLPLPKALIHSFWTVLSAIILNQETNAFLRLPASQSRRLLVDIYERCCWLYAKACAQRVIV